MAAGRAAPLPRWVVALAAVGLAALVLPLLGLGARVPWTRVPSLLATPEARDALGLSLVTSLISTALCVVLGVPLAALLARTWRGVPVARVLVLVPMTMPPVVAGLALLATFGRRGMLGHSLSLLGIRLPFTTAAVVIAQTFVAMPFLVVAVQSALRARPQGLDEAVATLGVPPARVFTSVTVPLVGPAIANGAALALARALGEFGATLTFAGSLQGVTQTMPLEIYLARETDPYIALALGAVLVLTSALVVAATLWQPRRRARPVHSGGDDRGPVTPSSLLVDATVPERAWQVRLDVPAGQVVAVMGPNGSGKSTLAQVVTGLVSATGSVQRDGRELSSLPAHRRGAALVTQQPSLLPFRTAAGNVELTSGDASSELARVGAGDLADRFADELSGGQQARVALARALGARTPVLVLDEPTAALDVTSAAEIRGVLARVLDGGPTTILVTHSLLDATRLADRLVLLEAGRVVADGTPTEVLGAPSTAWSAELAGTNLVPGVLEVGVDGTLAVVDGAARVTAALADEVFGADDAGRAVAALFEPAAVALYRQGPHGSPRSALSGAISDVSLVGPLALVTVRVGAWSIRSQVTRAAVADLALDAGVPVTAVVKATQVRVVARHDPAEVSTR